MGLKVFETVVHLLLPPLILVILLLDPATAPNTRACHCHLPKLDVLDWSFRFEMNNRAVVHHCHFPEIITPFVWRIDSITIIM